MIKVNQTIPVYDTKTDKDSLLDVCSNDDSNEYVVLKYLGANGLSISVAVKATDLLAAIENAVNVGE
jgi:hypothetical protein